MSNTGEFSLLFYQDLDVSSHVLHVLNFVNLSIWSKWNLVHFKLIVSLVNFANLDTSLNDSAEYVWNMQMHIRERKA